MASDAVPMGVCGFVRAAKSHVVWGDAAKSSIHQQRNHVPIEIGPGRHTVQ